MSKDAKNVPALRFKGYSDAWEKRKLGEVLLERNSRSGAKQLLSVTIKQGVIKAEDSGRKDNSSSDLSNYKLVKVGDIPYNSMRMWQGASGYSYFEGIVSPAYTVLIPSTETDGLFLSYDIKRNKMLSVFQRHSQGLTSDTWNLKYPQLSSIHVRVPKKNEQIQIRQALTKLDALIAATQHSIDALEQAKKALLQRLFDQSWRFKGYSDPWEKRKLGEVVERVTRKNRDLVSTRPLTISAQDGLVDQRKFFSKTVASKNISNYFLLKAGDFAYNKSYSVGYPWGAVKRLDKYPSGVLSTLYIVFKPKKINSQFLVTYFEGTTWYVSVSKVASEGARNHGLLNISASDFFDQQLFFPTKKTEQESIGLTIKVLDDLIAATQSRLSSLELLKKALLQDLFI
ncbi:restriction endonuclease subunit S [Lacticaseibacillus paracasei]|uniref:restriction endonuclease subunit S n=1 Tax=Lacticaseibacillus paracasei TaxID=1597 RepID=UPI0021B04CBE|nr:restriction endonuclease subunit S [Lacticaseibacillus paracasei]UWY23835.1 restriction endonuclease subunit S [Lacticaseibacillus paracasei]